MAPDGKPVSRSRRVVRAIGHRLIGLVLLLPLLLLLFLPPWFDPPAKEPDWRALLERAIVIDTNIDPRLLSELMLERSDGLTWERLCAETAILVEPGEPEQRRLDPRCVRGYVGDGADR